MRRGISPASWSSRIRKTFSVVRITAIAPSFPIASQLGATHPNDRQLILSVFFGGMSVGQLVYGPVSDSTGRKPARRPSGI